MLFPGAPTTAAGVFPKAELPRVPEPVSCFPEDNKGESVVKFGEDPNLKTEGVCEVAAAEEEVPVVLDAKVIRGPLVVILVLEEAAVAPLLLLAPSGEQLNIFWLVKLFETKVGKEVENEVSEAEGPLF